MEEFNFVSEEYSFATTPPLFCPSIPEGYVKCGGSAEILWTNIACKKKVIHCPGIPAGIYRVEELIKLLSDRKIKEMIEKGLITKEQAEALKKTTEEVYKKQVETLEKPNILAVFKDPIVLTIIAASALLIIMLIMKK